MIYREALVKNTQKWEVGTARQAFSAFRIRCCLFWRMPGRFPTSHEEIANCPNMATLTIQELAKSFGPKLVLQQVSFQVRTGEIGAIFGRNGSGKSTLFRLLFGSLRANVLQADIDGMPLQRGSVNGENSIGYLPQYAFLPARARVRNLIQNSLLSVEAQDRLFYAPKISAMGKLRVGQLSVGERRYLSTLLLGQLPHPFLLLDEPFSMLEPLQKAYIKAYLIDLKKTKGILLADHYFADVLAVADRQWYLQDGRLERVMGPKGLLKKKYLPQSLFSRPPN